MQIEAEKKGYPIFTINEENLYLKKGFNLLPKPSECDLFFDIESVQDHVFSGKLEYLFGVFYEENGKKIFKPFWAHNRNEEKQSVTDFFSFTKNHFKQYPNAKIYHYASYEITALEKSSNVQNGVRFFSRLSFCNGFALVPHLLAIPAMLSQRPLLCGKKTATLT